MSEPITRRGFLHASAVAMAGGVPVATATAAAAPRFSIHAGRGRTPVAVSSENGLKAVETACAKMQAGWRPVDAAVAGVSVQEDDPEDDSVGLGGLPNEEGVVELDSCVMDGPSGLAGAVAALQNIQNPSQVALKVMRHTDHVLLVGEGALRFARSFGFPEVELLTEKSRRQWLEWRARRGQNDKWIQPDQNGPHGKEWFDQWKHKTGTIHVGAVDQNGDCGSCTTTSGLAFKIPGRVGDSPLIGCGNYCDNDVGTAGATGRGEAAILTNASSFVVGQMALGKSPTDACLEACKRVARFTKVKRLLDGKGRPAFQVKFYAVSKAGEIGAAALYRSQYARCDDKGPRLEAMATLYDEEIR
jgi:N4-(beta-N-acetylglucosaminyl)-L-asparaginase